MRRDLLRFLLLPVIALASCDDAPSPTAPDALPAPARDAALRDVGIQLGDSHLTAVVTTTTDGSSTSVDVEAGYGNNGELRFGMYWTPNVSSVALAGIRYIGDRVD